MFLKSIQKRQTLTPGLVTVLYVRNLSNKTTEEDLHVVFSMGGAVRVDRVRKVRDFAFIHYCRREDAEAALERFNGINLHGCEIEVTWAKPPEAQKQKLLMEKNISCFYRQMSLNNLDNVCDLSPNSLASHPFLSRTNFRSRLPMINASNCFTVTKPVQLLQYLCAENNWGTPLFQVQPLDSDGTEICYICWVTISNLPLQFPTRRFMSDRICSSPDEAKHYAACHVLKKIGVIDTNFPYVPTSPTSLSSTFSNLSLSKNYLAGNSTPMMSKAASSLALCSPQKNNSFCSKTSPSPLDFFRERGQGDAGNFLPTSSSMDPFSIDNLENCPPLIEPDTPIEPNSILGMLSSFAAANNMEFPLFNTSKL